MQHELPFLTFVKSSECFLMEDLIKNKVLPPKSDSTIEVRGRLISIITKSIKLRNYQTDVIKCNKLYEIYKEKSVDIYLELRKNKGWEEVNIHIDGVGRSLVLMKNGKYDLTIFKKSSLKSSPTRISKFWTRHACVEIKEEAIKNKRKLPWLLWHRTGEEVIVPLIIKHKNNI